MKRLLLLLCMVLTFNACYAEQYPVADTVWKYKIKLLGNYVSTDPRFPAAVRLRFMNIGSMVTQSVLDCKTFPSYSGVLLNTSDFTYDIQRHCEPTNPAEGDTVLYTRTCKIAAVRLNATYDDGCLFSTSIDDLNDSYESSDGYPKFYAVDGHNIYFNTAPADTTTAFIYSYRSIGTSDTSLTHNYIPISGPARHIMYLYTLAITREYEGNLAAKANINGMAQSMAMDLLQIYMTLENTKDVTILPRTFKE